MKEPEEPYQWLKSIGQYRYVQMRDSFGCWVPAIFWVLTLFAAGMAIKGFAEFWWLPLITIAVATVSRYVVSRYILLNKIECPQCGYNPTRRKSDRQPRLDQPKVYQQLRRYTECPECGSSGES